MVEKSNSTFIVVKINRVVKHAYDPYGMAPVYLLLLLSRKLSVYSSEMSPI